MTNHQKSNHFHLFLLTCLVLMAIVLAPFTPAGAGPKAGDLNIDAKELYGIRQSAEMMLGHMRGERPAPAPIAAVAGSLPQPDYDLTGFKIKSIGLLERSVSDGDKTKVKASGYLLLADENGRQVLWRMDLAYDLAGGGLQLTKAALSPIYTSSPRVRLGYSPFPAMPEELPSQLKNWKGLFSAFGRFLIAPPQPPRQGMTIFFLMEPVAPGGSYKVVIVDPGAPEADAADLKVAQSSVDGWQVIMAMGQLPGEAGQPLLAALYYIPASGPQAGRRRLIYAGQLNETKPPWGSGAYYNALGFAQVGLVPEAQKALGEPTGDKEKTLAGLLALNQSDKPAAKKEAKRFSGNISAGLAYNDNISQISDDVATPSDLGDNSGWALNYGLSGNYKLYQSNGQLVNLGAFFSGNQEFDNSDFSTTIMGANLGWQKALNPFLLKVDAGYLFAMQDGEGTSSTVSLTPGASWRQARWTWTDLNVRMTYTDYLRDNARDGLDDQPSISDAFALNSMLLDASWTVSQSFRFPSLLAKDLLSFVRVGGGFMDNSRGDESNQYTSYRAFINVVQELPAEFRFTTALAWRGAYYDKDPYPLSADGDKRKDDTWVFNLRLSRKFMEDITAYASWHYVNNHSNIGEYYSYDQNILTVGLSYGF